MSITNTTNTTSDAIPTPRLALPPPGLSLDLTDAEHRVGWVRGDTIGFHGFGSGDDAARAAWSAHRALARRLDRRAADGRPIPIDPESLAIVPRGDGESILADGHAIATLLRPGAASASDADSFGFEIRLRPPTDELKMRAAAHLVHRTLRRSGHRWPVWTDAAPDGAGTADRQAPPRAPRDAAIAPRGDRRREASGGATFLRLAGVALIIVLVALAGRSFAVTQPITIPVATIAVAAVGAAAIAEANRRWQPRHTRPTHRARVARGPDHTNTSSRRAG